MSQKLPETKVLVSIRFEDNINCQALLGTKYCPLVAVVSRT